MLALAALLAALTAAAHAQLSSPGDQAVGAVEGSGAGPDTDFTPRAKDTDLFEQVAGASYGWGPQDGPEGRGVIRGSVTSFEADLFAVKFRNIFNGIAGGSEEVECTDAEGKQEKRRVPVLYQYFENRDNVEPGWHEIPKADIGGDCDNPGYIGAVAWIGTDKALAVGGTGEYPRREPAYDPSAQDLDNGEPYGLENDPAGRGRAWLYEEGEGWRELDLSRELRPCPAPPPEEWRCGMRGMTALDFDPRSREDYEWGAAGALGQLWDWHKQGDGPGGFTARTMSATQKPIRFRIRDIEFVPRRTSPQVYAVTSGCCAQSPAHNLPMALGATSPGSWGRGYLSTRGDPPHDLNLRQEMPDSFYSLTTHYKSLNLVSVIATPGGPPQTGLERASTVTQPYCTAWNGSGISFLFEEEWLRLSYLAAEALRNNLSSARLVAGDGDSAASYGIVGWTSLLDPHNSRGVVFRPSTYATNTIDCGQIFVQRQNGAEPDGVPDWAVGELRSTHRPGLGARALALATGLNAELSPGTVNHHYWENPTVGEIDFSDPTKADRVAEGLTSKERLVAYSQSRYFLLPSYSLNAIDMIEGTGAGWAVGDRGAILKLGEGVGASRGRVEPPPPALGSRRSERLPERHPYDGLRPPLQGEAGPLPEPGDGGSLFSDVPSPLRHPEVGFTSLVGVADGTLYATTSSDTLLRYDRLTGWDRARIPGWEPPRSTARFPAQALAVGPGGEGVVVGAGGRIANFDREQVALDRAAGAVCDLEAPVPPCGTGRNLTAAAVAPDGSAMVGGERLTLLWRPAGGGLRAIARPAQAAANATVTGIAMPEPGRAWITLGSGLIFAGELQGSGAWHWRLENVTPGGEVFPLDESGRQIPLRAIALDPTGAGYAVGDRGLILRRTPTQPWRRVDSGLNDNLTAVALAADGGPGVLVGGRSGLILSGEGERFWVVRPADPTTPTTWKLELTGPVTGLALAGGPKPGQVEAWAATPNGDPDGPSLATGSDDDRNRGRSQLFHHASDPDEPMLNPYARARALPDAPSPRAGEVSFAAFGNTPGLGSGGSRPEVVLRRTVEEIARRSNGPANLDLAVFTGDAAAAPSDGPDVEQARDEHLRWRQSVIEPLREAGLPLYAALGRRDLSEVPGTHRRCHFVDNLFGSHACTRAGAVLQPVRRGATGENYAWRKAMASEPEPWGEGAPPARGRLAFVPVRDRPSSVRQRNTAVGVSDPTGGQGPVWDAEREIDRQLDSAPWMSPSNCPDIFFLLPTPVVCFLTGLANESRNAVRDALLSGGSLATFSLDGARTHYAFDLVDTEDAGSSPLARLIFADNSLRSLAASDPFQQPTEPQGGQAAWLEAMLCPRGRRTALNERCTRRPGQQAIVVATTPTYAYGPTPRDETATDATAFEEVLMRHGADLVVSGRLGWNGRYWATAPGVHEPCPGADYQTEAPTPGRRACGHSQAELPDLSERAPAAGELADSVRSLAPPLPPAVSQAAGGLSGERVLPFVVASTAGGPFGAQGASASARQGFWNGYTVVRLDRSGDASAMVVEQRPVLDWAQISAASHVLRPGQRMTLRGIGREPMGIDPTRSLEGFRGSMHPGRFNEIENAAITHRYDLVEADPERPYLPRQGPDGGYVALDPQIATVDSESGRIRVGRGNHPRAFAIGLLSVGCAPGDAAQRACDPADPGVHVATWPLVFEPRRSFRPKPAEVVRPLPGPIVASAGGASISTPPQPPSPNPQSPQLTLPAPPPIPGLPTPTANPPAPPAPPAPPPPVSPSATPLDLVTTPVGLNVAPQATVIPPPAPPIQPAPPGGARREARQRQAATQKSGAGLGSEGVRDEATVDTAQGPYDPTGNANEMTRREPNAMTRHEGARPEPSITALSHRPDRGPGTALLYGGGLTLASLALALAYLTIRPRSHPRRRPPTAAAPAWNRRHPR